MEERLRNAVVVEMRAQTRRQGSPQLVVDGLAAPCTPDSRVSGDLVPVP